MLILGIDPGTRVTGYGVVSVAGSRESVVTFGVIRPDAALDHPGRLAVIYREVLAVVEEHAPDECAIEMPVYGTNAQSMLKLGRAQAAVMLAALHRQVPVTQYTPAEIKKSVTGNGRASKPQIAAMVGSLLSMPPVKELDAADALAAALCHAHRSRPQTDARHKSWASFVAANPARVRG